MDNDFFWTVRSFRNQWFKKCIIQKELHVTWTHLSLYVYICYVVTYPYMLDFFLLNKYVRLRYQLYDLEI